MNNQDKKVLLEDLIDVYVEKTIPETKEDTSDVKHYVKGKLMEDISREIINIRKEEIMEEIERKIAAEDEINKRKHTKVLVIETLFLGFLIGLLVNQGTDLITFIKGGDVNITQTLAWVIILLLFNMCFAFLVYIDKLNNVLNKNLR